MSGPRVLEKRVGHKVPSANPLVSIIIPAYNCTEFICQTLDSVFSQTFKDYEVILVNDGSADTEKLEKILIKYFDRIIYLKQENAGTAAARNTAIEQARGKYLAFLDSDDIWMSHYLETQMKEIAEKKCDMIYSDALLFGDMVFKTKSFMMLCPSNGMVTTNSLIKGECSVINSGTVVLHQKVLDVGKFDDKLPRIGMEDFDLWFRLAKSGARIEYHRVPLLKYRIHQASLSGDAVQRAERAVSVLKIIRTKYVMTNLELANIEKQLKFAVAALEIEKGKQNFVHKNFVGSRENFREGNKHHGNLKYSALIWLLTLSPSFVLKLLIKTPLFKAAFMSDSTPAPAGSVGSSIEAPENGSSVENPKNEFPAIDETAPKEDSLTKQSAWIFSAKIIGFGLNILLPLLTVRYLTPEQVGVYRQVFLVVANALTVLPLGFSMSAYYYLNREPEKHTSAIFNILLFNFVMGGLAFLTLFFYPQLLGSLFQNEQVTRLAPLVGAVIWLWIFSSFLETVALARKETRLATFFIIFAQFTRMLFMVGAVVKFSTVDAFIYAAIIQGVLQTTVLLIYLNRRYPSFWKMYDWKFFREQLVYALPFGFAALLYTSQQDIHNYFVSYRFSPAEFAIYSQGCFQIPLIAVLYESISTIIIPYVSQLQAQGKKREMLLVSVGAMQKLAFAYFPMFFFMMIVTEEFITTLFTKDYAASVPIFRINLFILPLYCLIVDPIGRAFSEVGKFLLKLRVIVFFFLIVALSFGIQHLDLRGIVAIVVFAILVEKIGSVIKSLQMLEAKREDIYLMKNVGKIGAAAALSGAILLGFYLPGRVYLMDLCISFTRFLLALMNFENAVDFVSGTLFLGICFIFYSLIYLFFANWLGTIATEDKNKLLGFWQHLTRRGNVAAAMRDR